jgi:hypothetical protein
MRTLALLIISACAAACDRSPAQTAGSATPPPALAAREPGAASAAPAAPPIAAAGAGGGTADADADADPRLPFRITRLYPGEAPSDRAPWHGGKGNWIFFDAETPGGGAFTAGIEIKAARDDSPIRFGKAIIVAPDRVRAERLVGEIAAAYHASAPQAAAHPRPSAPLQVPIAVLGENTACRPGGGCGGSGSWTATKWFFADGEVEVFVNLDFTGKQGEFAEKDEGYRAGMPTEATRASRPCRRHRPEPAPALRGAFSSSSSAS